MIDGFTFVVSYYDQPHLSELWWTNYREWDQELTEKISFIFVDDGSPKSPLEIPEDIKKKLRHRHFRIDVDIPWNQMGARNLAMKHVNGWTLLCDSDYHLLPDMAHKLLAKDYVKNDLYQMAARIWKKKEFLHTPIDMFIIHSETFWKVGGYAEQYAGHYGCQDMEFLGVHSAYVGKRHSMLDILLDHFPNGHITWLDRNLQHNSDMFKARANMSKRLGPMKLQKDNLILNFPWHEVTCV